MYRYDTTRRFLNVREFLARGISRTSLTGETVLFTFLANEIRTAFRLASDGESKMAMRYREIRYFENASERSFSLSVVCVCLLVFYFVC